MRRAIVILSAALCAATSLSAQTPTGTTPVGTQDPQWDVRWSTGPAYVGAPASSPFFYAAYVVGTVGGTWQPNGGGVQWISAWPTSTGPQGVGDATGDGTAGQRYFYTYRLVFNSLATGTLNFTAGWDNVMTGFDLNGTIYTPAAIATTPTDRTINNHFGFCRDGDGIFDTADFPNCAVDFAVPGLLLGSNTIQFSVWGDGATDGLWFTPSAPGTPVDVVTPEPATMTLLGSGIAMMVGAAHRRRRKAVTK